jgi:hypothetical protein
MKKNVLSDILHPKKNVVLGLFQGTLISTKIIDIEKLHIFMV